MPDPHPANSILPPCILLLGPTASGKTAVAVELVQRLPCEIVSVDSAQVYRGMDIGTGKPDAATLARAPHRLIDLIEPTEVYSAARFRADALAEMAEITARGRVPLLVGGTMLYFAALTRGLSALPEAHPATRAEIDREAAALGWPALHAQLARVDPETAARLEPNDAQRIQRALEVVRLTGRPLLRSQGARGEPLPYRVIAIGLEPSDRGALHGRIAQRFAAMLAAGLVEELRELRLRLPLAPNLPSMRCVGYRQAWRFLAGEIDLPALRETGIAATRQLAKRQLTWLRAMERVRRIDCLAEDREAQVAEAVSRALGDH